MKLIKGTNILILEKYGFSVIQDDEDYVIDGELCYEIGHSRRGQYYYYIAYPDGCIAVYGSRPDGSGGSIRLDDVILKLYQDGLLDFSEQ